MKVLYVDFSKHEGVADYSMQLVPRLAKQFEIAVVTVPGNLTKLDVKHYICSEGEESFTIDYAIKDFKPDVVHLFSHISALKTLRLSRKKRSFKLVQTIHNVYPHIGDRTFLKTFTKKLLYQFGKVDIFHCLTEYSARLIHEAGVSFNNIRIVQLGNVLEKDPGKWTRESARKELGLSETDKVVLYYGTIKKYKGLECLVAAMERLVKFDADYKLLVAGSLEDNMKEFVDSLKSPNIIIVPKHIPLSAEELYFKACDIVVFSHREIFTSASIKLASIYKKPAIVSDIPVFRDELDGAAIFFQPENSEDLLSKLHNFFEFPELNKDLGEKYYQRGLEIYNWDKAVEGIVKMYESLR